MNHNSSTTSIQPNGYSPFQSFTPFKIYHINHHTLESTMIILLEQAKRSKIFTIDTKHDSVSDVPALIQVECIGNTSIIILFDCWHLPDPQSPLFHQISHLVSVIFDPTKEIQAWGNIQQLLLPFIRFNVFSITHLQHAHAFDLRQLFRE